MPAFQRLLDSLQLCCAGCLALTLASMYPSKLFFPRMNLLCVPVIVYFRCKLSRGLQRNKFQHDPCMLISLPADADSDLNGKTINAGDALLQNSFRSQLWEHCLRHNRPQPAPA